MIWLCFFFMLAVNTYASVDWNKVERYAGIFKPHCLMEDKLSSILTQERPRPDMVQITDRLYIGGQHVAMAQGFELIIDVLNTQPMHHEHCRIPLNNNGLDRLLPHLQNATEKIGNVSNGDVLVFCDSGRTRSVSIAIAYLIKQHRMNLATAIVWVKSRHPTACPRGIFLQDLLEWELQQLNKSSVVNVSEWIRIHKELQNTTAKLDIEIHEITQRIRHLHPEVRGLYSLMEKKQELETEREEWEEMGMSAFKKITRLDKMINDITAQILRAHTIKDEYETLIQEQRRKLDEHSVMISWLCISTPFFRFPEIEFSSLPF